MAIKKIIVHQKNSVKPTILTDEDDTPLSELKEKILNIFNSDKIYTLETKNDLLIGRSSEIQSILVSDKISNLNDNDDKSEKYKKGLKINGKDNPA